MINECYKKCDYSTMGNLFDDMNQAINMIISKEMIYDPILFDKDYQTINLNSSDYKKPQNNKVKHVIQELLIKQFNLNRFKHSLNQFYSKNTVHILDDMQFSKKESGPKPQQISYDYILPIGTYKSAFDYFESIQSLDRNGNKLSKNKSDSSYSEKNSMNQLSMDKLSKNKSPNNKIVEIIWYYDEHNNSELNFIFDECNIYPDEFALVGTRINRFIDNQSSSINSLLSRGYRVWLITKIPMKFTCGTIIHNIFYCEVDFMKRYIMIIYNEFQK